MAGAAPILILGVARSGSTWIAQILGSAAGARYVHEPDNETNDPFALAAKAGLGRYPRLAPGDRAPTYEACWEGAFAGGVWSPDTRRQRGELDGAPYAEVEAWCDPARSRSPRLAAIAAGAEPGRPGPGRPVVKSVHALLAAEWIVERFAPALVLVRRQPLNVVASWRAAAEGDARESALEYSGAVRTYIPAPALAGREPPPAEDRLRALAWFVGLLASAREEVAARTGAVCVDHDVICRDPGGELRAISERLGLDWGNGCERRLAAAERPGDGFVPQRIAAEQPDRWRERLSDEDVETVERVLAGFPGGPWFGSPPP